MIATPQHKPESPNSSQFDTQNDNQIIGDDTIEGILRRAANGDFYIEKGTDLEVVTPAEAGRFFISLLNPNSDLAFCLQATTKATT